ncbi:hypothetical protein [Brevibacillus dissolubilis]|uniref:hypothetical protein n=1 Tax=Brevibacillus dissolubilis TaxID=1844116 RepID=UPI0011167249|nr:hypothetical protein [Brevibacillus dissolubilis]
MRNLNKRLPYLLNITLSVMIGLTTGYISGNIVAYEQDKRTYELSAQQEKRQTEERILELFHDGERWFKFEKYEEAINSYEHVSVYLDKLILDNSNNSLSLVDDDELRRIYITMLLHLRDSYAHTSKKVSDPDKKRQLLKDMLVTYEKMGAFETKNPLWFITGGTDDGRSSPHVYLNSLEEIGNTCIEIIRTYEHTKLTPRTQAYINEIFDLGINSYEHRINLMEHFSVVGPGQEYQIKRLHRKIAELGALREFIFHKK